MNTKVCKKCGIERERDLFNKKGKDRSPGSRVSTCRVCLSASGIVYSVYNYPTEEMNQIAKSNALKIKTKLRKKYKTVYKRKIKVKVCPRCTVENLGYKKQICTNCRRKEDLRRIKEKDERQIHLLKDKYIRKLFKRSLAEYELKSSDIPQELIELKRKQILLTRELRNHV